MSKSINSVQILGHLGRDAEVRHTPSGKDVVVFSVATSHSYKQGDEWKTATEWHDVTFWGGEKVAPYLKKGAQVFVQGRLQTRSWTSKDGQDKRRTEIVAQDVILCGREPEESRHQSSGIDSGQLPDEDLPF